MPLWAIPIGITLLAASLAAAWFAFPRLDRAARVARLRAQCARRRAVCLTYDDGPGDSLTRDVMDLLEAAGGRATFFMLGARAESNPDLPAEAHRRGHEVGSHTFEHLNAWKAPPARANRDIDAGIDAIESRAGAPGPFRPPYGRATLGTWLHARRRPTAWWTLDSGDTHKRLPDPASVVRALERAGGGVVLLHDFDQHRSPERTAYVLEVTRRVLRWARSADARVCTLADLRSASPGRTPSTGATSTASSRAS
ncbi:MAG: polysaccharide deacetylase family protein [Phycisphaerales bacterium]